MKLVESFGEFKKSQSMLSFVDFNQLFILQFVYLFVFFLFILLVIFTFPLLSDDDKQLHEI